MNDLISRAAAIDALDKDIMGGLNYKSILQRLPSAQPEITQEDVELYCRRRCLTLITNELFHEMQARWSAQLGRYKWNSIKDGLPDEEGAYFVTDDAGGMATVYLDVFSHYEDGSPYWLYSQNVTAWMHTPEPYKECEG